ncbi:MAG: cytochrome C oxidase subunit IV family protein [Planctomycetes bacterium]|nr:cytochrome C oxidase subunit IV family protein [Planctomycetota bacterium]
MTDPHSTEHARQAHEDHGIGKYLAVFVALCLLTSASFFTYSRFWPFHDTPQVGWVFMMAVSCTKAMLVILFFMHVKYEASWKYVLTIPPAIMAIFLMLALVPDVGLRSRMFSEERKDRMAHPADVAELEAAEHAGEH